MAYNPNIHHRRSIRLKGYDYSQEGLYFITMCVQNRECLFGKIVGATLVVAQNESVAQNEIGQPQGIAPTGIAPTEMILNDAGKMIETQWLDLKNRFPNIELHEFVVMPNHFHGILEIVGTTFVVAQNETVAQNEIGQPQGIAPTGINPTGINPTNKTVGDMMDAFKSITTVEYIRGVKNLGWQPFNGRLWQRNYWEHIIRNEKSYHNISEYIINNPTNWNDDKLK